MKAMLKFQRISISKHLVFQSCTCLLVLLLTACTSEQATGPGELRWDKDTCERCNMAVEDRLFAAQIRWTPAGEKSQLYQFDDIGCAVIWLEQQAWKHQPGTEIWVTDYRNGAWIDARTAYYIKDIITPMDYGLGAQPEPAEGALDYAQAIDHIMLAEKEHHKHSIRHPIRHE